MLVNSVRQSNVHTVSLSVMVRRPGLDSAEHPQNIRVTTCMCLYGVAAKGYRACFAFCLFLFIRLCLEFIQDHVGASEQVWVQLMCFTSFPSCSIIRKTLGKTQMHVRVLYTGLSWGEIFLNVLGFLSVFLNNLSLVLREMALENSLFICMVTKKNKTNKQTWLFIIIYVACANSVYTT